MNKEFSKAFKVTLNMLKETFFIFFIVFMTISLINSFTNYFGSGASAGGESFGRFFAENAGYNFSGMFFVFSFVSVIIIYKQIVDLLLMFSVSRKSILKVINIYSVIFPVIMTFIISIVLIFVKVPFNRAELFAGILLLLYFSVFYTGFLSLLGRKIGWYYVVGTNLLLAAFLLLNFNTLYSFFVFHEMKAVIYSALIVFNIIFFAVDNIMFKSTEYKNWGGWNE